MKQQIIAIGGSLAIAGTIFVASRSASGLLNEKETENPNAITALAVHDSTFELPKTSTRLPALLIKQKESDTASVPLRMSRVKMDIKVVGNISTTTLDITYCNDLDRLLDGQFCFPLGEGQNISYFALENDGKLNEASVVEKAKGRQTYEAVIRRKVDPALLEWTAGNNFRTRIYPIPAHGCRRVVVKYESELIATGKSNLYYQPIGLNSKLEEFSVHAEVLNQPARPQQFDEQGIPVKFETENQNWVMNKTWVNYNSQQPLAFEIPADKRAKNLFVESNKEGNADFYFSFYPKKFKAEKKLPSTITLLWDVSGSGEQRNTKAELNILEAYLKKVKTAGVKLVTFSNDINSEENIQISDGNISALREKISKLVYDGATQLGSIQLNNYPCDEFILVSDALNNFGSDDIKPNKTPVHIICSSPLSDYSFAKGIAQSSGGKFINLMTTDSASCVNALCTEDYHFISAEYDQNMISQVYPSSPVSIAKTFSISGKLEGYTSEIKLNFGIGNNILYSERVTVINDPHDYKGMVNRIWAEKKLNELDIFYERNKEEITSIGKKYEIVTRNTSLLVLDRLEDYLEHKVVPKDPAQKKLYLASVDQTKQNWEETKKAHLDQVASDFEEMKTWYNTDYYSEWLKKKKELEAENKRLESERGRMTNELNANYGYATDSTVTLNVGNASNLVQNQNSVQFVAPNTTTLYSLNASDANAATAANGLTSGTYAVTLSATGAATYGWDFGQNGDSENREGADIALNAYNPQTPYMTELKKVPSSMAWTKYLLLKKQYASTPSFFVDVSDYFVKIQDKKTALRILSNIAEMDLENHQLLRVLAHRLQELHETKTAISVFEKILEIREEEPQSYRDLGLAYAENKEYQKAVTTLCKVVNRQWDGRFPLVEAFVACEINNIISLAGAPLNLDSLDKRLVKPMPCDVRVVINWDTDNCDMDLWVTDPEGEKCFYGYNRTQTGGRISNDFTGGYGPETFMIKKALVGKYKVQVNYFGSREQGLTGPTTVQAELYTNWGRSNQTKKTITLRLKDATEVIDLGALAFAR